jgi:hypothetical protein
MKTIMNDLGQETFRRLRCKLLGEWDDYRLFDTKYFEIGQPLVECLKKRGRRRGIQDSSGMRIKGYCRRDRANSGSPLNHGFHYSLMSYMKAVKYTKRQHCRPGDAGVLGSVKYLHIREKGIFYHARSG